MGILTNISTTFILIFMAVWLIMSILFCKYYVYNEKNNEQELERIVNGNGNEVCKNFLLNVSGQSMWHITSAMAFLVVVIVYALAFMLIIDRNTSVDSVFIGKSTMLFFVSVLLVWTALHKFVTHFMYHHLQPHDSMGAIAPETKSKSKFF